MLVSLAQAIHQDTDHRFFPSRVYNAVKTVVEEQGGLTGGLTIGATTVAQISTLALSYFCLEGSVRSFFDVIEDTRPIVRLRYLGDAGGWTSLSIFSLLFMKNFFERIIAEGEYTRLKSICQKWIQDNKSAIEENPKFCDELYLKINDLLDAFNMKRLFSNSLVSRRLTALKICQESELAGQERQFSEDKKLETILLKIQSELEGQTCPKQYLHRLYEGEKKIIKRGYSSSLTSLIFGVAIPIILLSNVIFSVIGEFGLGKELFIDKEELTDVGHFGEWPINAIEAFGAAFFLHLWYILNEGDFEITRKIYANQIENFQGESTLHNRLCDIANAELSQISNSSNYLNLPIEYEFEKL